MRKHAGLVATGLALAFLAVGPARAQMPPATYQGPIGERLKAEASCLVTSFGDGGYVAPWAKLRPGQYRNPTTCAVEGAPR